MGAWRNVQRDVRDEEERRRGVRMRTMRGVFAVPWYQATPPDAISPDAISPDAFSADRDAIRPDRISPEWLSDLARSSQLASGSAAKAHAHAAAPAAPAAPAATQSQAPTAPAPAPAPAPPPTPASAPQAPAARLATPGAAPPYAAAETSAVKASAATARPAAPIAWWAAEQRRREQLGGRPLPSQSALTARSALTRSLLSPLPSPLLTPRPLDAYWIRECELRGSHNACAPPTCMRPRPPCLIACAPPCLHAPPHHMHPTLLACIHCTAGLVHCVWCRYEAASTYPLGHQRLILQLAPGTTRPSQAESSQATTSQTTGFAQPTKASPPPTSRTETAPLLPPLLSLSATTSAFTASITTSDHAAGQSFALSAARTIAAFQPFRPPSRPRAWTCIPV